MKFYDYFLNTSVKWERCNFYVFGYILCLFQLTGNCRVSVEINKSTLTLVNFGTPTFTFVLEKKKCYVVCRHYFCGYFVCDL